MINLDMVHEFIAEYGWYAVCFLLGFLVTMIRWAVKHPEDFFTRDDAPDEAKETEER